MSTVPQSQRGATRADKRLASDSHNALQGSLGERALRTTARRRSRVVVVASESSIQQSDRLKVRNGTLPRATIDVKQYELTDGWIAIPTIP